MNVEPVKINAIEGRAADDSESGGTGFQPVVSGLWPETGATCELQLWLDDTHCVSCLATPSGVTPD